MKIGFIHAGSWSCEGQRLRIDLAKLGQAKNVLYAFVVDDEIMYIGKSIQSLARRMYGYCNPSGTQRTNWRNNQAIRDAFAAEKRVELYALPDNGLLYYGGFHVNLAAGLEDSLIRELRPAWNGAASGVEQ